MGGSQVTMIIMIVVIVIIIGFVIVTTITGSKASKKEKAKRKGEVRDAIKTYISKEENQKNIRVDFERVYARKGPEYKYRDVFDVIVLIIEPKTNKVKEERALEVEGISTKVDKKNYSTTWQVNGVLDLEETKRKIAIAEKEIKLTKEEKKLLKKEERLKAKELQQAEKQRLAAAKKAAKNKPAVEEYRVISNEPKFVPTREKK